MAIKEIDLESGEDCFDELRAEISTLMTCDHPNIIRYRGSYVPNNADGDYNGNIKHSVIMFLCLCVFMSVYVFMSMCVYSSYVYVCTCLCLFILY